MLGIIKRNFKRLTVLTYVSPLGRHYDAAHNADEKSSMAKNLVNFGQRMLP